MTNSPRGLFDVLASPQYRCPAGADRQLRRERRGGSAQYQSDRHTHCTIMDYQHYVELGFRVNNITVAIRLPHIKLKRPSFWRRKRTITSLSSSTSSSASSSSEDWIRDFHARYNPLHTERSPFTTSTPVRTATQPGRSPTLNVTGVKIYEYLEDLAEIVEEEEDAKFDIVDFNNIVIAKAVFPTLKSLNQQIV